MKYSAEIAARTARERRQGCTCTLSHLDQGVAAGALQHEGRCQRANQSAGLNARRASVGYQYEVAQAALYAQLGEAAFLAACMWRNRAPRVASWLQRRSARWYATARWHAARALGMLDSPPNRA